MTIAQALQMTIEYLENREREHGERHPSLPSLKAYLLDEQESAGLEGKTKAELIALIKGRKKLESPIRITPGKPEATQIETPPIYNQVEKDLKNKPAPEATDKRVGGSDSDQA